MTEPTKKERGAQEKNRDLLMGLATGYYRRFELATRGDGSRYWRCGTDDRMLTELCHHAHGDLLPDDYIYTWMVEILGLLSEMSPEEALSNLEPDLYTRELTNWLGSHGTRIGFLDEAIEQCGDKTSAFNLLAYAQIIEKEEVFFRVLSSLEDQIEDIKIEENTEPY